MTVQISPSLLCCQRRKSGALSDRGERRRGESETDLCDFAKSEALSTSHYVVDQEQSIRACRVKGEEGGDEVEKSSVSRFTNRYRLEISDKFGSILHTFGR